MSVIFNSAGKAVPQIATYTAQGAGAGKDGALSLTITPTQNFRILNITAHAASSVATALTVTLDSSEGSAFDTVLSSDTSWTNLYKVTDRNEIFQVGDALIVACTDNAVVKSVIVRIELL